MGTSSSFSSSKPSLPTKTLVKHIKRRDWSACRNRLQSYPWDAHWVHKVEKTTPLHLVCVYRAPVEVVKKLVDANPSAITARNDSGWTPLHLIVLHGSDPEVAILLIQRGGVEACSVQSPFSGSPLHLACFHGTSKDVLRAIVAANPSMVSRGASSSSASSSSSGSDCASGGKKPAEQLWHRFCRNPTNKELVAIVGDDTSNSRKQMTIHQVANAQELLGQIQILMDGLAANVQQQTKMDGINNRINNTSPIVQSSPLNNQMKMMSTATLDDKTVAATTGAVIYQIMNNQPEIGDLNDFLEVAILSFPESHLQYVDPKTGNWLLHAACSRPPLTLTRHRTNRAATTTSPHSDNNNDRDLIDIFVNVLPSTAAVKNNNGDYPLHLAITKGRRTWHTGISSLVRARSQLVHVRDRESGLYPFQLAASVAGKVVDESPALETIFQLLLSCPHILTEG
mmetsp:Transcript_14241/g.34338  ORF Transcript_14241/g.34338 Transcript_14241/m.34338 type:complete len:454 (-) Transcript_14241:2331-3692(-)